MAQPNKPSWRGLYLIGTAGGAGLVAESVVKVAPQAHLILLLGWVALVFGLIGKWISNNATALNAMDEEEQTPSVERPNDARISPVPICERTPSRMKNPIRRSKTL